jgi:hypothetical protein
MAPHEVEQLGGKVIESIRVAEDVRLPNGLDERSTSQPGPKVSVAPKQTPGRRDRRIPPSPLQCILGMRRPGALRRRA